MNINAIFSYSRQFEEGTISNPCRLYLFSNLIKSGSIKNMDIKYKLEGLKLINAGLIANNGKLTDKAKAFIQIERQA